MKQIGTVVEIDGQLAKVECDRKSACDMCENAANCVEKCKKVYATALNVANAEVGDTVEIETDTHKVLYRAFIVFMVPVLLSVGAYFAADLVFGEALSIVITFSVLVFSLCLFSYILNRSAKKKVDSRVVKIIL